MKLEPQLKPPAWCQRLVSAADKAERVVKSFSGSEEWVAYADM